jgi:hypothetical protein
MNSVQSEDQKYYLRVWKASLAGLLGWSEHEIGDWIQTNCSSWAEGYAVYVHEPPEFWVIPALIPNSLRERIGAAEIAKLKREILTAIDEQNPKWFSPEYDWCSARLRINHVLSRYKAIKSDLLQM